MKVLAVIPHYRHPTTIAQVVQAIQTMEVDCLVVDDGSADESMDVLAELACKTGVQILYRTENGGKGAAVKEGIHYAVKHGYTHVLQVDADAQHQLQDAKRLLDAARHNPSAVICAEPVYGEDAPKSRLYGRKITNFWLVINTLSFDIHDGMCGFRVYPLSKILAALTQYPMGNRMDFDIDILMGLHRLQCPFVWIKTPVFYSHDGVSHFHAFKDNLLISKMHSKWFFNMLVNLPRLLHRKCKRQK